LLPINVDAVLRFFEEFLDAVPMIEFGRDTDEVPLSGTSGLIGPVCETGE
jgi:hypothetical protein